MKKNFTSWLSHVPHGELSLEEDGGGGMDKMRMGLRHLNTETIYPKSQYIPSPAYF